MINIIAIASRSPFYDKIMSIYWFPFIRIIKAKYPALVRVYLLFGSSTKINDFPSDIQSNLYVARGRNTVSQIPGIMNRNIEFFKHLINNGLLTDGDYIFRTNLSSFLLIDNLIDFVSKLDKSNVYNGVIGGDFISGAGMTMTIDVIRYIIANEKKLDRNTQDDVAIGLLLKRRFKLTRANRFDIHNGDCLIENAIDAIIAGKYHHVRVKTSSNEKTRQADFAIMEQLMKRVYLKE